MPVADQEFLDASIFVEGHELLEARFKWHRYKASDGPHTSKNLSVKILHSFYRGDQPSGENDTVLQQVALLSDHGFDVELISLSSDDLEAHASLKVLTGIGLATGVQQARPPLDWFADADILHIHNTFPSMSHKALVDVDTPKVLTAHNYRAFCANGLFLRDGSRCTDCVDIGSLQGVRHGCYRQSRLQTLPIALQQRSTRSLVQLMSNCDRVLLPGEPMRGVFEQLGLQNTQVLHNPVSSTDAKSGFTPLTNEWLFVGRMSPEKGLVDLIRVWPKGDALAVVGDGPERQMAEEIAFERELIVRFLGGRDSQGVKELMSQSLGLIFPSKALEGAPLVYGEAMQAGLPVIAAEGSTLATQADADGTGVTFSFAEPETVVGALESIRNNRAALSSRARDVYLNRYTTDAWITQATQIYEGVVAAHHPSRHS